MCLLTVWWDHLLSDTLKGLIYRKFIHEGSQNKEWNQHGVKIEPNPAHTQLHDTFFCITELCQTSSQPRSDREI